MKVILNQEEIVEAISEYLRDKLNLDNTASVEMSFTAGRAPNGYSASVDITYPTTGGASRIAMAAEPPSHPYPEPQPEAGIETVGYQKPVNTPDLASAAQAVNLFGT